MAEENPQQNDILNEAKKNKSDVTVILLSGVQLKGKVKSFDNFTILLDIKGKDNLIYKHFISTIVF